jgi:hypothetical protein
MSEGRSKDGKYHSAHPFIAVVTWRAPDLALQPREGLPQQQPPGIADFTGDSGAALRTPIASHPVGRAGAYFPSELYNTKPLNFQHVATVQEVLKEVSSQPGEREIMNQKDLPGFETWQVPLKD